MSTGIITGDTSGMEMFLVRQWTEFRFGFSTLAVVLQSIQTVKNMSCQIDE